MRIGKVIKIVLVVLFVIFAIPTSYSIYALYHTAVKLFSGVTYSWNQKIIATIETPQGLRSGFSVQHVEVDKNKYSTSSGGSLSSRVTENTAHSGNIFGEAVVVILPNDKTLFVLLDNTNLIWPNTLYPGPDRLQHKNFEIAQNFKIGQPVPIPLKYYPTFVTFSDLQDPASLERVAPQDLAAILGPGYELKSLTVERTDEPLTTGRLEMLLPWLASHKGRLSPTQARLATDLTDEEKIYPWHFERKPK